MKNSNKKPNFFKRVWNAFTTYEKIWYFSILILAFAFAFIFPETDDPTYTLNINSSNYSTEATATEFTKLDFHGTEGSFVIDSITIGDEEYDLKYLGYTEWTVDESDESTLVLTLPKKITKDDNISFDYYPDSDELTIVIKIVADNNDVLYTATIENSTTEGTFANYSVEEHAVKYLVSVKVITILYLLDIILNITCELLISKQSKWNFIVSLGVEVVEILVCIACAYRFATLALTILFWIPCDIISFILWNKHPDKQNEELTVVKKLTPLQDVLVIVLIAIWTVGVGYLLTFIDVDGGIFANNVQAKNIACYLDACASAVGVANGVFILLRYREQWIAWYICSAIETVINILAGQWILLILKAGYFTNTTYGYIKWTKYIKKHNQKVTLDDKQETATTE